VTELAVPTLDQLVIPGVQLSYTSLVVTDPELPFEAYAEVAVAAGRFKSATSWWIGDLLNFGEKLYGDRYVEAMEATGLAYETLTNYASVCRKVARSRRREGLRFGHHAEVSSLEPLDQELWLDAAVANAWTRAELRDRLRASKDAPAQVEQPKWKAKEPVSEEPLSADKVEEAEHDARKTLESPLPAGHPLWETRANAHARDVVALAQNAKVSLRDAAQALVAQAQPNGNGVWVPREAFEAVAAALEGHED
jgi:hypothetical protein